MQSDKQREVTLVTGRLEYLLKGLKEEIDDLKVQIEKAVGSVDPPTPREEIHSIPSSPIIDRINTIPESMFKHGDNKTSTQNVNLISSPKLKSVPSSNNITYERKSQHIEAIDTILKDIESQETANSTQQAQLFNSELLSLVASLLNCVWIPFYLAFLSDSLAPEHRLAVFFSFLFAFSTYSTNCLHVWFFYDSYKTMLVSKTVRLLAHPKISEQLELFIKSNRSNRVKVSQIAPILTHIYFYSQHLTSEDHTQFQPHLINFLKKFSSPQTSKPTTLTTPPLVQELLRSIDKDHNEYIDWQEFKVFLEHKVSDLSLMDTQFTLTTFLSIQKSFYFFLLCELLISLPFGLFFKPLYLLQTYSALRSIKKNAFFTSGKLQPFYFSFIYHVLDYFYHWPLGWLLMVHRWAPRRFWNQFLGSFFIFVSI
eukprot:TRINITY_DN26033_c0_g1_i1.p1 TRINITY_DN26033_c0_g1~~TRINITY_DN26033_c0_g1_i1.p1  ORF type:complete len:425 (-),score=50.59 TRINITY_DN26033_c0_g1_i1:223-1497(-)